MKKENLHRTALCNWNNKYVIINVDSINSWINFEKSVKSIKTGVAIQSIIFHILGCLFLVGSHHIVDVNSAMETSACIEKIVSYTGFVATWI